MISTAITSTGMRQTQTLTAPPTQNTAPVLEFRCLFSHDLVRKQKRWRDGFLRFHTFNKRIMVYDAPSRNYIGDKHWREDEVLQDGDELQLEKPVLVQVGEAIGTTETDLTELLEKRRKPTYPTAGSAVHTPRREAANVATSVTMAKPLGQPPQLRPKSLNALLGTPRGPTGLASVPTKSPHEIRQKNESVDWQKDRPAKRQRLDHERQVTPGPVARPILRTPAPVEALCTPIEKRPVISRVDPHLSARNFVGSITETIPKDSTGSAQNTGISRQLSKEAVGPVVDHPAAKQQNPAGRNQGDVGVTGERRSPGKSRINRHNELTSPGRNDQNTGAISDGNPRPSLPKYHRARSYIGPIEIHPDGETISTTERPNEKVKLQMASRKPRKKLIYRDLLPEDPHPTKRSSSSEGNANLKSRVRSTSKTSSRGAKTTLADFHEEERNRLADRLNKYKGKTKIHRSEEVGDLLEKTPRSPGLFVSEDGSDFERDCHIEGTNEITEFHGPIPNMRQHKSLQPQAIPEQTIPMTPSTIHDTALILSKMDEIMFSSSERYHPARSSSPQLINNPNSFQDSPSPSPIPVTPPSNSRQTHAPTKPVITTLVSSSPSFQSPPPISPKTRPKKPVPLQVTPPTHDPSHEKSLLDDRRLKRTPARPLSADHPPQNAKCPNSPSPNPPATNSPAIQPPSNLTTPTPPPPSKPPSPQSLLPTSPSTTSADNLSILQKPLPAYQAPRAKPKSRSPLRKSTSDTTSMRAPPPPISNSEVVDEGREAVKGRYGVVGVGVGVGESTPWSKEAWDLFGCGRDGVECGYEEFKRKEGLM